MARKSQPRKPHPEKQYGARRAPQPGSGPQAA